MFRLIRIPDGDDFLIKTIIQEIIVKGLVSFVIKELNKFNKAVN
jgi:hypothetical protein